MHGFSVDHVANIRNFNGQRESSVRGRDGGSITLAVQGGLRGNFPKSKSLIIGFIHLL